VLRELIKAGCNHGVSPVSLARTIANDDVAKCFADLAADAAQAT
jgi:hypothetical protein